MKKNERKEKLKSVLKSDELLYQNKPITKRVMNPDEPLKLVQQLETVSFEVLGNLTGSSGRRAFYSLLKNKGIKRQRTYGVGNRNIVNAIYSKNIDNQALVDWQLLGQSMWFLREKGMQLGAVSRLEDSDDLITNMIFNQDKLLKLQFKHITDSSLSQPITAKSGYTLVLVFDSFGLLETTVNQHNNQFMQAINDGCFLISISKVQDFEVVKGLILSVVDDDKLQIAVTHVQDMATVNQVNFKQVTTPDFGTITQLNWEYDEALNHNKVAKTHLTSVDQ
ncbi:hypothetical protein [Lactiplantibacillus plantarum]|uniref:hypothetical protein n=1 Tax=Lactiplantibacillus plantarum TaxID=1590 RepID=UPI001BACCB3E|nr:hypothetical protein [Lactiplantibacillus plantarum]MBS0955634.1 hypothetical protein [Lactiplantibacillus plantarum]